MIKVFIKSYFNQNVISGGVGAGCGGFPVDGRCHQPRQANRRPAIKYHRYCYTHNVNCRINAYDYFRTNPSLAGLQSRSRRYLILTNLFLLRWKIFAELISKKEFVRRYFKLSKVFLLYAFMLNKTSSVTDVYRTQTLSPPQSSDSSRNINTNALSYIDIQ